MLSEYEGKALHNRAVKSVDLLEVATYRRVTHARYKDRDRVGRCATSVCVTGSGLLLRPSHPTLWQRRHLLRIKDVSKQ